MCSCDDVFFFNVWSLQHFVHATFCPRNHLSMRHLFRNVLSLQHFVHATFCPQQFVRNILSATICPRHFVLQRFVLRHFVHATFCPQHFVRDILSCDIQSGHRNLFVSTNNSMKNPFSITSFLLLSMPFVTYNMFHMQTLRYTYYHYFQCIICISSGRHA